MQIVLLRVPRIKFVTLLTSNYLMTHMTAVMMKLPVAQMRQTENMAKLMYLVSLKSLRTCLVM